MGYKYTKEEQETTIRFDANHRIVEIFTAYPPVRRKIEKKGYSPSHITRCERQEAGWFYRIPYGEFTWRVRGARKPLPPEKLAELVARGKTLSRSTPLRTSTEISR